MSILQAIAPLYLAVGVIWAISVWRYALRKLNERPTPVVVMLIIGVLVFIIVIGTWPFAALERIFRSVWHAIEWFHEGLANRELRRLMALTVLMGAVNVAIQAASVGTDSIITTIWGWAFAVVVVKMGYDIGTPRGVIGGFEAIHVEDDGTRVPIRGRLLLDNCGPPSAAKDK